MRILYVILCTVIYVGIVILYIYNKYLKSLSLFSDRGLVKPTRLLFPRKLVSFVFLCFKIVQDLQFFLYWDFGILFELFYILFDMLKFILYLDNLDIYVHTYICEYGWTAQ